MKKRAVPSALLTMLGVVLVTGSVVVNAILQNGDRYTTQYLLAGIPGVLLIVWNGPKWLRTRQASGN